MSNTRGTYELSTSPALNVLQEYKRKGAEKITIQFKAVGNTPIMRKTQGNVTASQPFHAVIRYLRKELGWGSDQPLHTFINMAFAPAPDDTVSNLFKSFAVDGVLIVNYR